MVRQKASLQNEWKGKISAILFKSAHNFKQWILNVPFVPKGMGTNNSTSHLKIYTKPKIVRTFC